MSCPLYLSTLCIYYIRILEKFQIFKLTLLLIGANHSNHLYSPPQLENLK
nr:MAG TPA: hypothetical protein [Caudoviricetes sp.]